MLRLRAFRHSNEKIVHLELHPTYPWLASADASDNVVVWDWQHRQVVYEVNAGGTDAYRLVGSTLRKLAEGEKEPKVKITESIKGGSVKQIKFYDEDVRFWHAWLNRSAAGEAPVANQQFAPMSGGLQATRGRHFLVICCENKVVFLDMVTMRSLDVPKQALENKSPLCMEFLPRSALGDGPFVGFGGSDGVIRVLSMATWQLVRKYVGGHKGAVSCLMTFLSSSGEMLLVSGASDGLMVLWTADSLNDTREMAPKHILKAHDGGVYAIEFARVLGGAPQLITIGADKTLAIWDTVSFKELKRIKPVGKLACHSVASWCHPRAPALDILTCVKDSHIWSVQHSTYTAIPRPLCDLSSQVPPSILTPNKKLKCYCMTVHSLQPHLVATGTNLGVILSEFDARALPSAIALPTPPGSKEHMAAFIVEKEIRMLNFQLSVPLNTNSVSGVDATRPRHDSSDSHLQVKQFRKRIAGVLHDAYSSLSISKSGKHLAVVWPDVPYFAVYRVSDWSIIDSGSARHFAWDSCKERYALIETTAVPRLPQVAKGKKAKEAAAQAAAAAAAAASAAAAATVQVRIILDDGSANQLTRSIEGRTEPVTGLQGGALLGVSYRFPRRISFSIAAAASAASAAQAASFSGVAPTFSSTDDGSFLGGKGEAPSNFQLYSWETFKPVGSLVPEPEWTAWDPTVEYCAMAYPQYIVIASLRPQYRYLGNVAIAGSTGGVWHRRQLFLATATTIECVFVDGGINAIDLERKKKKEDLKNNEAQARAMAEHGELALITVDNVQSVVQERVPLRPPMLQVVRLASFQHAPTIPPFMTTPRQRMEVDETAAVKEMEDKKSTTEVAVAGGGVSVAISRLPPEQKRPVGPLVVVGVRDGVLWLIDRYMTAHAIGLGHPGIRCRCLAAYGDAISAVKWATRLGREHHDDLAQFMMGMGYATEALHLPGISKRLEFDLALQSNDLKRALQCLLTLSKSRNIGQENDLASDPTGILSLPSSAESMADAVQGIIKFAKEFLDLVDAADATAQMQIASQALRRLSAAGAIKGALQPHELRALSLRLASHGELTRLGVLVNTMIAAGQGREAALGAALLGDSATLEKALQETGMYAEAALHAHAHGRPTIKNILQSWNKLLQKDEGFVSKDASLALSQIAAQKAPQDVAILQDLTQTNRKPLIEIVPPGNVILSSEQNAGTVTMAALTGKGTGMKEQTGKPLMLQGPALKPLLLEGPQPVMPAPTTNEVPAAPPPSGAMVSSPGPLLGLDNLSNLTTAQPVPTAINMQQPTTPDSMPRVASTGGMLSINMQQPTTPDSMPPVASTPSQELPSAITNPSGTENVDGLALVATESKAPEPTASIGNGTPSVAALVDFFS